MVKKEIAEPSISPLSVADREAISKTHPIVLIGSAQLSKQCSDVIYGEHIMTGSIKLGDQIRWIATTPEGMDDVNAFLRLHQLSQRVSVISLDQLSQLQKSRQPKEEEDKIRHSKEELSKLPDDSSLRDPLIKGPSKVET